MSTTDKMLVETQDCPECDGEGWCQGVPGLMEAPEDATYTCPLCRGKQRVPEHVAEYVEELKSQLRRSEWR